MTNPFKFMGGMVLEIAAVVAVLALLPAMGTRDQQPTSLAQIGSISPNQVFFDASSARNFNQPATARSTPPAVWGSDFAPRAPIAQQRFVENVLDHNSQRAMDVAAQVWTQGDRILPEDLRVARQPANEIPSLVPSYERTSVRDRGELIELPSARSVASVPAASQHPSFAETYQRPMYNETAQDYQRPQFNQTAQNYQPEQPQTNYGSSYYSRPTMTQTAQPRVRSYNDRY